MYQIDQYSHNIHIMTSFFEPFLKKTTYIVIELIFTYPPYHYFFPQIKCGFWNPNYLPLVTMSLFLLFFFKSYLIL